MGPQPTRQAYGDVLIELGSERDDFYVIDCDIAKSMKTIEFSEKFPQRHINVGIAEQNAAGVAAGLATLGYKAIVSTYAVFGSMRMLEQIRTSACYTNLNVKVCCSHGGLTPSTDGVTHQAIEDMGIYRTIPNMAVMMPADYYSTKAMMRALLDYDGPCYIRFTRDAMPNYYGPDVEIVIGKGKVLREGCDLSIIANGDLLHEALKATEALVKKGIDVELIDMHTIKPLDEELILKTLAKTGKIITVEDHNVLNGLGSAVADVIAVQGNGIMRKVGLKDQFAESGPYHDLLHKYEMDSCYIIKMAEELLKK
ncbi:MAG: transketolase [Firmicutes bacterium HGW-Firmicutes-3]|jgi:transketolase|nr:MAG: transketolase [Firmicutes bacterium HGW-Firmicutes-3]